ncbi:anti-sigma factor, partial [uncultured Demequina sp.]|uniref:anti-sigma factor n=1 Tax=uncultured Demequina sp. TaxID=693499 RepID=UPI0025E593D5
AVEITEQVPAPAGAAASADAGARRHSPSPERRFRTRTAVLVAASALFAVVVMGVTFFLSGGEDSSQLAQDLARIRGADDVVEAPLDLGETTVYLSATEGIAVVGETPPLTDDQTYQLWIVPADGSAPVPGPVMAPGTSEAAWDASLDGAAAIAVSVEPDGGSTTPTEVVGAVEL